MRTEIVEKTRAIFVSGDDERLVAHLRQADVFAHLAETDPKLLWRCWDELRADYAMADAFTGVSRDIAASALPANTKRVALERAAEAMDAIGDASAAATIRALYSAT